MLSRIKSLFSPKNKESCKAILDILDNRSLPVEEVKKQAIKLIKSRKYNLDGISNPNGYSPLMLAISRDFDDIAILMIKNGADVNYRMKNGMTALFITKDPLFIKELVRNGADVNTRNLLGLTPLHNAKYYNTALALIQNGANVNAMDLYGSTPLHKAVYNNKHDIASLLKRNGASSLIKNIKGKKPYQISSIPNHIRDAFLNDIKDKGLMPSFNVSKKQFLPRDIENKIAEYLGPFSVKIDQRNTQQKSYLIK